MFACYGHTVHDPQTNDLWRLLSVRGGLVTHSQVVTDYKVTGLVFVTILNLSLILDKFMVEPREDLHSFLFTELSLSWLTVILDETLRHAKMEAEDRFSGFWVRIYQRMDGP